MMNRPENDRTESHRDHHSPHRKQHARQSHGSGTRSINFPTPFGDQSLFVPSMFFFTLAELRESWVVKSARFSTSSLSRSHEEI